MQMWLFYKMDLYSLLSFFLFASNLCAMLLCLIASGYNLDTDDPQIFHSTAGNYFGYTVALHVHEDRAVALIGAPRANSSVYEKGIYQPGVLFSCQVTPPSICTEVNLNITKKGVGRSRNFRENKDNAWLGVSLDVQQNVENSYIVTCSHLRKINTHEVHYAIGACYIIDSSLKSDVIKLDPLSAGYLARYGTYYNGFGEAGTSAAFSEDGKYLLLGAPGFFDWRGTVVSYVSPFNQRAASKIPYPPTGPSIQSYIGYAVTTGTFYGNNITFFAVGAPRDANCHGLVYIFSALNSDGIGLSTIEKKRGNQLGEYFGAAVLGVNLNNDAYTDLLVGAPLSSTEPDGDEGKVYVYTGTNMNLTLLTTLTGSAKPKARFGSSIANANDLNQDGYKDIAIGAPYEEGHGAIYIYHGSLSGIKRRYVQRILAATISSSLSGFGIYISRGLDIDNNKYPDILVGSYSSSNAVLFRSRPIIWMSPKLDFFPKQINMNATSCEYLRKRAPCVNITACLRYNGKHVPNILEFEHEITLDYGITTDLKSPRGIFLQNGGTSTLKYKAKLTFQKNNCVTHVLYIHPNNKDIFTPIRILYKFNKVQPLNRLSPTDVFPIIDPSSPQSIQIAIPFQTECETDDICHSDLKVVAGILGNPEDKTLIIGKNTTLTLLIKVRNKEEAAYMSELLIYIPSDITSINQDFCSSTNYQQKEENGASLLCDLGNPLLNGQEVKIQIKLDVGRISVEKQVNIYLEAKTISNEINHEDNNISIPINFRTVADISITGTPSHEQIPYEESTDSELPINIGHTYIIMNHGPSPVHTIDVTLYVPAAIQDGDNLIDFLVLMTVEVDSEKQLAVSAKCKDNYHLIKPIKEEIKPSAASSGEDRFIVLDGGERSDHYNYSIEGTSEALAPSFLRSNDKRKITLSKKRNDTIIDCETAHCMAIQCSASPFLSTRNFASIKVTVQVNVSVLRDYLQDPWYRAEFVTRGEVKMRGDNRKVQDTNQYSDEATVKSLIIYIGIPPTVEVAPWIIPVSSGVGILLLIIILIVLVKVGFFKRKQKEELQRRKSQRISRAREPHKEPEPLNEEPIVEPDITQTVKS